MTTKKKVWIASLSVAAGAFSLLAVGGGTRADFGSPSLVPNINVAKEVGAPDATPVATPEPTQSPQAAQSAPVPQVLTKGAATPQTAPETLTGPTVLTAPAPAPTPELTAAQLEQRRVDNLPAGTYYNCNGTLQPSPCVTPVSVIPTDGGGVTAR